MDMSKTRYNFTKPVSVDTPYMAICEVDSLHTFLLLKTKKNNYFSFSSQTMTKQPHRSVGIFFFRGDGSVSETRVSGEFFVQDRREQQNWRGRGFIGSSGIEPKSFSQI